MVHYKLTYFGGRGLAEPSRQIFALAGVEYEDIRHEFPSQGWTDLKPKTPFGTLPLLEIDGVVIPESAAISRYLAKEFGFAGRTNLEAAWVDAIIDQYKELFFAFRQLIFAEMGKKPADEIERVKREVFVPAVENYLKNINKILEKSKSGFLVGDGVTLADLTVADNLKTLEFRGVYKPAEQPKLAEFYKKITSLPKLKEWIAKRPNTDL